MGQDSSQTGQADYYLAQVSSASLYYPFGWEMPGRKFVSGEGYRFGFNGQEEDPDIAEGHTTALYWEYDSRIARRWNVDPRPRADASPYSTFAGNPIVMSDVLGDTSIIYTTRGELLGQFLGPLKPEIHFINRSTFDHLMTKGVGLLGTYTRPLLFEIEMRNSSDFFIGEKTLAEYDYFYEKTNQEKREFGGLTYISGESKELKLEECAGCEETARSISGIDRADNYKNSNSRIYLTSWHTHPYDNDEAKKYQVAVPSGYYSFFGSASRGASDFNAFESGLLQPDISASPALHKIPGGVGLIRTQHGITVYQHSGRPMKLEYGEIVSSGSTRYESEAKRNWQVYSLKGFKMINFPGKIRD